MNGVQQEAEVSGERSRDREAYLSASDFGYGRQWESGSTVGGIEIFGATTPILGGTGIFWSYLRAVLICAHVMRQGDGGKKNWDTAVKPTPPDRDHAS